MAPGPGLRVVVFEVVDHLLDAHRVHRRRLTLADPSSDVGVAGGIDVDRFRPPTIPRSLAEVLFVGSGATAAVNKLVGLLGWRISEPLERRYGLRQRIPERERPVDAERAAAL